MANYTDSVGSASICVEPNNYILKSVELMLKIEGLAQTRLRQILADIQAGKITLEEVNRQRGLL